jgi:hypothetical protein
MAAHKTEGITGRCRFSSLAGVMHGADTAAEPPFPPRRTGCFVSRRSPRTPLGVYGRTYDRLHVSHQPWLLMGENRMPERGELEQRARSGMAVRFTRFD